MMDRANTHVIVLLGLQNGRSQVHLFAFITLVHSSSKEKHFVDVWHVIMQEYLLQKKT